MRFLNTTLAPKYLFEDLDQFFNFNQRRSDVYKDSTSFPSQVTENEEGYLASVDLPGVEQEDIQIELKDSYLTIKAERKDKGDNQSFRCYEKSYRLSDTASREGIEAAYENGVLRIFIPKSENAIGKIIEVQSGKGDFFKRLIGKSDSKED